MTPSSPVRLLFVAAGLVLASAPLPGQAAAPASCNLAADPAWCSARPGDLIRLHLRDVHPTQPSLGYDEVYYKLGRYLFGQDKVNKRFDDWCEANGQEAVASARPGATLHDPSTFTCTLPLGSETAASIGRMKTVVIGPGGQPFLTDGHHTFTSFWETPDGGPDLVVRVRVEGNLSTTDPAEFWREMVRHHWTWLADEHDRPILPDRLPAQLGLSQFADDPYRGVLYFVRDIGYRQASDNALFQEFYWGRWLRYQTARGLRLSAYNLRDRNSYLTLVDAIAQAMVKLDPRTDVGDGRTAAVMGRMDRWNDGEPADKGEFGKLGRSLADAKPGKLAFALAYRASLSE